MRRFGPSQRIKKDPASAGSFSSVFKIDYLIFVLVSTSASTPPDLPLTSTSDLLLVPVVARPGA
jgi:hypothetical protein